MSLNSDRPSLADVAARIGPEPWLLPALEHFSQFIGWSRPGMPSTKARKIDEKMLEAAKYLYKWLQSYEGLEKLGFECPECVHEVQGPLWDVIELLEADIRDPARKLDGKRSLCASVVIEAWQLIHGKIKTPESLLELCRDYWLACGGEWTDQAHNTDNWRRPIQYAIDEGQGVREIFETYRMSLK